MKEKESNLKDEIKKHKTALIILGILTLVMIFSGIIGTQISQARRTPTPTRIPTATYAVYSTKLTCRDCAEIGMEINLWKDPNKSLADGNRAIASLPHGTTVQVTAKNSGWYKVSANGIFGWVKADFVELKK
jgi:hypothetical protein